VKRPRPYRLASVLSAVAIGVLGALVIASPASAHDTATTGVARCVPEGSGWIVAWTVDGSDEKERYKILTATAKDWSTDATVGGAFSGELGSLPTAFKPTTQSFTGEQTFPNSVAAVWLSVGAHWENNDGSGKLDRDATPKDNATRVQRPNCGPGPNVTFASECDHTITVTLANMQAAGPVTFTISGKGDVTVAANATQVVTGVPGDAEVTVTATGMTAKRYTWTPPTTPCQTVVETSPPPPALAVTGGSLSGPLTIGGMLLGLGLVLIGALFIFRRRRTVAGH
jgi:hypothetical protein